MAKPIPFTTKTGIRIGEFYEPPLRKLNIDEEYWQAIYLRKGSMFTVAQAFAFLAYFAAVFIAICIGVIYGN